MKWSDIQDGNLSADAPPPPPVKWSDIKAPADPGFFPSLLEGFEHGVGNVLYGGARIGARMGPEEGGAAFARPEELQQRQQVVDKAAADRETTFQASGAARNRPITTGAGTIAGEAAGQAPFFGPLLGAAPATIPGRMGLSAALGAGANLATPHGGESMDPTAQLQRGAAGAIGGVGTQLLGEAGGGLVTAIAGNAPAAVDRIVTQGYRRAVRPSGAGEKNFPRMTSEDRKILGTFDEMIDNKNSLRLTDPRGISEIRGQTPQNLLQFSEAIQQRKTAIWDEIAAKSAAAGEKGATIDLSPLADRLKKVAGEIELANPAAADAILADAARYEARGTISPKDAEGLLKTFNRETNAFWEGRGGNAQRVHALVEASNALRQTLDDSIEKFEGPGYQALRNRYANLKETESAVAKAALRDQKNVPGGLIGELLNAGSITDLIHGMIDPTKLPRFAAMQGARYWIKAMRNPNAAINRLFNLRSRDTAGPFASYMEGMLPALGTVGAIPGGLGAGAALPPEPEPPNRFTGDRPRF